ncbi:MAG: 30S ribosomal protein S21 [Saprospiraceae bacterium]|nr:30S ribosomal protein S21 [Saprospiraceae bacterium]
MTLIINVKEDESIDRAIKRYRRKYRDTKMREEIMKRKYYTKPSIKRRKEILKAEYKLKKELAANSNH